MRVQSAMRTVVSGALVLFGACARPHVPEDLFTKPAPPAELAALDYFVGTWTSTAEIISPSPEELRERMPEGAPEMPSQTRGGGTIERTLDGMFFRGEGWYEMGPDQRVNYVEYITWDPKARKYHSWMFSDWGEFGEGWMTFDQGRRILHTTFEGTRGRGEGTVTLVDNDTMEWTMTERGPMGRMTLKGTSRRERGE